ncbi:AraC family transcriptional regulator [Paenibacillus qinlingensis]|uniref:AraC-like DNA-binding protein n=1 Tax=Paenibacillus qinlingensis TaxID=1837343 RepID=A0ABU1NP17_9BACL|nr:AraC family transcriptional regulator [Paenibacillus qinlingensis]MDR6549124.1 AraC-like DNA-binding protein [Paenibacillus qinlingensis]
MPLLSYDRSSHLVPAHLSLPFRLNSVIYLHHLNTGYVAEGVSYSQLILCCKGKSQVRLQDQACILQADQVMIIMPYTKVEAAVLENQTELAVIRFDCHLSMLLQFRLSLNKSLSAYSTQRIQALVHTLHKYEHEHERALLASETIYALLAELKLQTTSAAAQPAAPKLTIQKIINYIYVHHSTKLTLDGISRRFGYTAQHLNKLFKNELGDSIYQYILKVQLDQAAHLLENEEMTIEQVAEKVGMEPRSFYRLFQKLYRVSPGEFRRTARK